MAICYRCGKNIRPSLLKMRRKVKTGEWVRKNYPANRVGAIRTTYGQRIVCHRCAHAIDLQQDRSGAMWLLQLGLWLSVLLILLIVGL